MFVALAGSVSCVVLGALARQRVRACAPPLADALLAQAEDLAGPERGSSAAVLAEIDLLISDAAATMALSAVHARSLSRVALALGTGCSVLALASAVRADLLRGVVLAGGSFSAGLVAAALCAQLGRSASALRQQCKEAWSARRNDAERRLGQKS